MGNTVSYVVVVYALYFKALMPSQVFLSLSVYVDVCEDCVDLTFQLGQAGTGATIGQRTWSIKVFLNM